MMFPKPVKVERKRKPLRSRRHRTSRITKSGHEFLHGVQAHARRRIEVFEKQGGKVYTELSAEGDIEAVYTAHPATCGVCESGHLVSFEQGHWIHGINGSKHRHCDCIGCTTFGCKPGHAKLHHDRIRWT